MKWIVFLLALVCAACSSRPEGARLDPALRLLVPTETKMLGAIQVEEFVKTPFYQKHLSERALPMLSEFSEATGVDIRKNLWEVMLLSDGEHVASVARGKFSEGEAEPRVKLPDGRPSTRFGYRSYTMVGDDEMAVLLMGPTLVGIGHTALLKRVVDARGESNGPRGVIAERMKEIPYEAEVWGVFTGSPANRLPLPKGKNATIAAQAANSIQSGAVYIDAATLFTVDARLYSDADANAKQLHGSLKGLLGIGQVMSPEYQKALQSIQVTQDGNAVHLRAETTEDTLVPLFQLFR